LAHFAAQLPQFAVGNFSTQSLILTLAVTIVLILGFGWESWLASISIAAHLGTILVAFGVAFYAVPEVLGLVLQKSGVSAWSGWGHDFGIAHSASPAIIAVLQQPLFVVLVLPTAIALATSVQRLMIASRFEDLAVKRLRQRRGVALAMVAFFVRVFNHVAHVVVPTASQVLKEEGFSVKIREGALASIRGMFFAEEAIAAANRSFKRLWRVACGVILLAIEFVPLWAADLVDLVMEGRKE
jgi:hypothetical protein